MRGRRHGPGDVGGAPLIDIQEWWSAGQRELLAGRHIWTRRWGSGPPLTLLHGFPSSSHDFAKVAPALAERYELLTLDLLGFGASDKPEGHEYSLFEQADLVEALWAREGIASTVVVAHDYSVTIAQELLARRADGSLAVELERVVLLNGGLYPDLHRPQAVQQALLDGGGAQALTDGFTPEGFAVFLRPTFAPAYDAAADSAAIFASCERGGFALGGLIRYMPERAENAERWVGALESTDVPLSFAWGMLDPVSGAHMAERIRERLPAAPFVALEDVGHWPPLEAPERVAAAIL